MAKEKDVIIAFRAPATLRDIVKEFIALDMHMNESDFYRDAVRQKNPERSTGTLQQTL
jgi:hypothetical protein